MIPRELVPEIEEFVSRVKAIPGLEYVVVYGSVVRGRYTEDSDLDVLVLFADERSEKKNASKVRMAAAGVKGRLPIIPSIYNRRTLQMGDPDFFRGIFKERGDRLLKGYARNPDQGRAVCRAIRPLLLLGGAPERDREK